MKTSKVLKPNPSYQFHMKPGKLARHSKMEYSYS